MSVSASGRYLSMGFCFTCSSVSQLSCFQVFSTSSKYRTGNTSTYRSTTYCLPGWKESTVLSVQHARCMKPYPPSQRLWIHIKARSEIAGKQRSQDLYQRNQYLWEKVYSESSNGKLRKKRLNRFSRRVCIDWDRGKEYISLYSLNSLGNLPPAQEVIQPKPIKFDSPYCSIIWGRPNDCDVI